ncbi:alpha/beta hydrolase [Bacillus tianshenii]|uniref:alpha/beta hydrolase n=1 Tax=Sutcliffiella tianshenii TaxID=1463404 RepID=UPI001CD6D704|nr:alpha/beta hydrolase [Bacillus tianshenii]MCA1319533.1 alpha/beta hydrolase [Bacillus tianshenii]
MSIFEKETYLNQYDLSGLSSIHHFQFITTDYGTILKQSFLPAASKGTIFLVHGYLDHSGSLSLLIRFLVSNSFSVITFDLPGHGYSYGPRGDIDCFGEYVNALDGVITSTIKSDQNRSYHIIGHSTGCSVITEYLIHHPPIFEKVILVAPLIKPYLWSFSQIGVKLIGKRLKSIKRKYRKNASNKHYLEFVKNDPLQFDTLPTNWVVSLSKWHEDVFEYPIQKQGLHLIQGNRDTTVDWRFNVSFLLELFPGSDAILIDEGNHQLFNEAEEIRSICFNCIKSILLS